MRYRLIAGQIRKIRCARCDAKRAGSVYRDLYEWRIRFPVCGHEKSLGYTKPMDILEEEGFIET